MPGLVGARRGWVTRRLVSLLVAIVVAAGCTPSSSVEVTDRAPGIAPSVRPTATLVPDEVFPSGLPAPNAARLDAISSCDQLHAAAVEWSLATAEDGSHPWSDAEVSLHDWSIAYNMLGGDASRLFDQPDQPYGGAAPDFVDRYESLSCHAEDEYRVIGSHLGITALQGLDRDLQLVAFLGVTADEFMTDELVRRALASRVLEGAPLSGDQAGFDALMTEVLVALEAFHALEGRYPDDTSELVGRAGLDPVLAYQYRLPFAVIMGGGVDAYCVGVFAPRWTVGVKESTEDTPRMAELDVALHPPCPTTFPDAR